LYLSIIRRSRDSIVCIAIGYVLEGNLIPGKGKFSLLHSVKTGFGAQPASYLMRTWNSVPRDKAARA
jgi:hypothetical protein